jgi:hypothetical protein
MINDRKIVLPILGTLSSLCDQCLKEGAPIDPYRKLKQKFDRAFEAGTSGNIKEFEESLIWISNYAFRLAFEAPLNSKNWELMLALIDKING